MNRPLLFLATAVTLFFGLAVHFETTRAALDPDPSCPGNVCTGTVSVGGRDVGYAYTLNHDATSSSLKFRFTGDGYVNDGNVVNFSIVVSKAFDTVSTLKNPDASKVIPSNQSVNLTNTQVERLTADGQGMAGDIDFTQNLRFESPSPGTITVTVTVSQYGDAAVIGPLTLQLDASAPSNRNEGESLAAIYGAGYLACADGIDNDLDYRIDCADSDCAGQPIGGGSVCEAVETTCNDGKDNDGNGLIDCQNPVCNGRPGNLAGTKFCGPEDGGTDHANCGDGFDNNGNGLIDCHDPACWRTGYQDCAVSEIIPSSNNPGATPDELCSDGIDNDRDSDYSEAHDDNPATGADCRDYDCRGYANCTDNERLRYDAGSGTFVDDPSQCFNGLDDDLDGLIDCRDPDCLGASFGGQSCSGYEAWLPPSPLGTGLDGDDPAFHFNFCDDGLDNDGDGLVDGADPDCLNGPVPASAVGRFGECGPVPSIEDYTFLSCSDGIDNDRNGAVDCGDARCAANAKLGRRGCLNATCSGAGTDTRVTDAAACTVESGPVQCGDGFDNDANGLVDCFDPSCTGVNRGPPAFGGYLCALSESGAACSDGHDNDGDGFIDCMDPGCQDGIQCALRPPAGWSLAPACISVPNTTALAPIVSGGGVEVAHDDRIHVNDPYRVRFAGSGSFSSLTLVLGDAIDPAQAFPFDASETNCALSGTGASQMTYVSSDPAVGVIFGNYGETLVNFDVTLTCTASSPTVIGPPPATYPVAVVANRGGVVEFGETTLAVQVYENVPPAVSAVEIEGLVGGSVNVPVGGSLRIQAIPTPDDSGICRCDFDIDGQFGASADGNCLVDTADLGVLFANDSAAFPVAARAVDGADNASATSTMIIDVNVLPSVRNNLTIGGPLASTYRGGALMNLSASFETDTLNHFDELAGDPDVSACDVYLYKEGVAPSLQASSLIQNAVGNQLDCDGTWEVPAALAAGRWYVVVAAVDSSGDMVRSNAQPFLKCDLADVGVGDCKDADFDQDGVPEGRFTPNFAEYPWFEEDSPHQVPAYPGDWPDPRGKPCDNCVNLYNPSQLDRNANGIGDACEAGAVGRCKYKWCSEAVGLTSCLTDDDCSGVSPDSRCIAVDQHMCTINCVTDDDCSPPNTELAGSCTLDWGVCEDNEFESAPDVGSCCFDHGDCSSGSCRALVKPFIETGSGQIFSAGDIRSAEEPPVHNATYCLLSGGEIINFTSERGCRLPSRPGYVLPRRDRNYVGSFGVLDVNGILGGKYGSLLAAGTVPAVLGGAVYHFTSDLAVASPVVFQNTTGSTRGNGLVIIEGGDLRVSADVAYQEERGTTDLRNLASVGWIVLKHPVSGVGGNVIIDPEVESFVGAVFAEGTVSTGAGNRQLKAVGVWVAEDFAFERTYASRTGGAERVVFDARVILNPPPGMADVTRSLPGFQTVPGR